MTGYFVFDVSNELLAISNSLTSLLGLNANANGPKKFEDLVVGDSENHKPTGTEEIATSGRLKLKSTSLCNALFKTRRLGGSGLFITEFEILDEIAEISDNASLVDHNSMEFLTSLSHELRSSLSGVIGFANLLGNSGLNAEQSQVLEKMQSCNFMLKGLISDMLEYSRVESSKVPFKSERVQLGDFARNIAGLFSDRAEAKGLELIVEAEPSSKEYVRLPKQRVEQVLSNLMSNAIKFTEAGSVTLTASVEGGFIRFAVSDTGPGVPSEDVERIFQPFSHLEKAGTSRDGVGLGLSISKRLAQRMNGSLYLESQPTGGSSFHFDLPDDIGPIPEREAKKLARRKTKVVGCHNEERESRCVLIVEDNKLNADILSHFLREYGVSFEIVDNGRSAVEVYEDGKYDLILMDVMLPEMNGYEATEKILSISKRSSPVPIVGVTAKVFRRDQMRCLESGMVEVLHKPVDFKALGSALDRHLYGKEKIVEDAIEQVKVTPDHASVGGFDRKVLDEYFERMSSEHKDSQGVLNTALSILDEEIGLLAEAIASDNRESVVMRAHSLKGALAILGSRDLLDLAKALESVASQSGVPIRKEHWKALIEEGYRSFKNSLRAYVAQLM